MSLAFERQYEINIGSSVIAICEVAGMGCEITVRNVVWGIRGSP